MKHLSEAEIVDLVEGRPGVGPARHAETCDACRARADALRAVLASARCDEVPEPSPVFWDHLSARISNAIQEEPTAARWIRLAGAARWRLAAAAAAVVLAAGLTWQLFSPSDEVAAPAPEQARAQSQPDPDVDGFVDAWEALETVAQDLDWEDAQSIGIAARPGSAEPLVGDLTDDERSELVRLIEEEIKRHRA